jgi:SET domain-containing protein
MSSRSFRIGRGSAGLGLFATRPFKKGEFIVAYRGRRVTDAESARREARGARYMFEINSRWAIDGSSRKNLARYVNHSCRPNAEAAARRGYPVTYIARRKIKPGEEITVDYGKDYFEAFITKKRCRCEKCRERRREARRVQRRRQKRRAKLRHGGR